MFEDLRLALNFALFAVFAAAVWRAGVRLTHFADRIAQRTGMGCAEAQRRLIR